MSTELLDLDDSLDSPALSKLSSQQKLRLTTLLDEYLQAMERGVRPDSSRLLVDNPDLAEAITHYLQKLEAIFGLTAHQRNNLADVPISELPFKQLGDFELLREIGRGGMGVVYEAKQSSIGRRVALKLLSLSSALNPKQIARFHNEARAAGLLQHDNIVPVYSVGMQQGIHFYAMQLIEGISIEQWAEQQRTCDRSQKVGWRKIVAWIAEISTALHAAHEAGIIHRDVKPSNLLLDSNQKIWITDFGLARCTQSTSVTVSGDLVGTVRYMCPEQATGKSALVDGGADIYALAATLYEMLCLRPAIEGDDPTTILTSIANSAVQPLRSLRPDLPRDLDVVVSKAMSFQRYHRYDTAQAFSDDLRRVLDNVPTIARPVTAIERVIRWSQRHQRTAASVLAVMAVMIVGLIVSSSMLSARKSQIEEIAKKNSVNEKLLIEALDQVSSRVDAILSNIPAAEVERKQLLEEILRFWQLYASNSEESPGLRRSFATALGKIGVLHGELGASDEAIRALRESERAFSELVKLQPTDWEIKLEWSISLNNLGQALLRKGSLAEASRLMQQALQIQQLVATMNDNDQLKLQSALSLANWGLLRSENEDFLAAEDAYRRSIQLLRQLSEKSPSQQSVLQLARVETDLAAIMAKSRPQESIELAREALARLTRELEREPGGAKLSRQTSTTLNALGSALYEDKQYQPALETYRQAEDIMKQLVSRWPEQPDYRSDLAASLNQIGLALIRLDKMVDAKSVFERALEHQQQLADQFATDSEVLSATGRLFYNYGYLCRQLGNSQQAEEAFKSSSKYEKLAVDLAPEVRQYRDLLEGHQSVIRNEAKGKHE